MKKILSLFACFLINSVVFAQKNTEENEKAIKACINQLFEGMRKTDSLMIKASLSSNCRMQVSYYDKAENPKMQTDENPQKFITNLGTSHPKIYDERMLSADIKIDDNLAVAWVPYEFWIDDTFSHKGVDIFTLAKDQSGWKIIYLAYTRNKK